MKCKKVVLSAAISALTLSASHMASAAESVTEALTSGKAFGDFRLRYESVEQDNALEDASGLTLRSRIGYATGSYNGFSATIEAEDSRIVAGQGEFSVPPAGYNAGQYSVIADPEHTEIDQAFVQYKNDVVQVKAGRQVYTLDGHRFVGHVGWRQDRQTFDALTAVITPVDNLTVNVAYIGQQNGIFGDKGVQTEDVLLNVAYKTPVGTLKGYGYFLEKADVEDSENETVGLSFGGEKGIVSYYLEAASQETASKEAMYSNLELGVKAGPVNLKAGYEVLGSDDGTYGFQTPYATKHKFNGWADMFLGTPAAGLEDVSLTASGKLAGGKLLASYHMFSANEGDMDYGTELDLLYAKKFGNNYNAGIKYAMFTAEEEYTAVDTDKLWIWVGMSF